MIGGSASPFLEITKIPLVLLTVAFGPLDMLHL
jgi:hypothetical protein